MSYSDFTLKKVKTDFNLEFVEDISLFADIEGLEAGDFLKETLRRNLPLAFQMRTGKARSELIVVNVLLEVKEMASNKISLFSGIDFSVDKDKGLSGFCDFVISNSPEQLFLEAPIVSIVEAKNDDIVSGLGQCIAEMVAAEIFNANENQKFPCVHGVVTSGEEWKFLKLSKDIVYIDRDLYSINELKKILGIFISMVEQKC